MQFLAIEKEMKGFNFLIRKKREAGYTSILMSLPKEKSKFDLTFELIYDFDILKFNSKNLIKA